jgi:hypothetical protein
MIVKDYKVGTKISEEFHEEILIRLRATNHFPKKYMVLSETDNYAYDIQEFDTLEEVTKFMGAVEIEKSSWRVVGILVDGVPVKYRFVKDIEITILHSTHELRG